MYMFTILGVYKSLALIEKLNPENPTVGVPALYSRVQRDFWMGSSDWDSVKYT